MSGERKQAAFVFVLGLAVLFLSACGTPVDGSAWYGGAPDAASCEGRGGVVTGSLCRFESDLRHLDFFFNNTVNQRLVRLTPSNASGALLVIAGAKVGDRVEWSATGTWAEQSDGCATRRDLSGNVGAIPFLNEGQPQGLFAYEEGATPQILGNSSQFQIQSSGNLWLGLNTPADASGCWQIWPTKFVLLHCEDPVSLATVVCP